jgi:hypothetical protein
MAQACALWHISSDAKTHRPYSLSNFIRKKTLKFLTRFWPSAILEKPLLEEFPLTFQLLRPGAIMSSERRIAPRKFFSIPIRIRPLISESLSVTTGSMVSRIIGDSTAAGASVAATQVSPAATGSRPARVLNMQEGETVNLSERGILSRQLKG